MKVFLSAFADEAARDFRGQLEALKDNSIGYVELRKIDGVNISRISSEKAREYKAMLDDAGVKVWSLGSPLAKQLYKKDLAVEIETARRLCELARIFECGNIRAFSFFTGFRKQRGEIIRPKLRGLVGVLSEQHINYCLENDTGLYADVPERVEELLECFPEMKFVYDPANFIVSGCRAEDTLKRLCGRAYYFHIKDARGKRVVPSGFGNAGIDELVKRIDRDCVCTVEPHLFAFRGVKGTFTDQYDLRSSRGKFDLAVDAFKKILTENGYAECDGCFEKKTGESI